MQSVCQTEKTVLGHGGMKFEVARAVESSPIRKAALSSTKANLLKSDRPNAIAIAKGLIQAFGGIAVISGETQLVGSWDEVEELMEGNDLSFDSMRIEFQEAREEPILLLNTVIGSGACHPFRENSPLR